MDFETALIEVIDVLKTLIVNNWSFVLGAICAILAFKFLKSGLQLAITIIFVALVICVLTNMGILPPFDELIEGIKNASELPMTEVTGFWR